MAARVVEKEMGITHQEFFRLIGVALGTDEYEQASAGVTWTSGGRRGSVTLGPEGKRQIALLALPRTEVRIELEGYDDAEADTFLHLFDRAFQRGGG